MKNWISYKGKLKEAVNNITKWYYEYNGRMMCLNQETDIITVDIDDYVLQNVVHIKIGRLVKVISKDVFINCPKLETIELFDNSLSIDEETFNAPNLKTIIYKSVDNESNINDVATDHIVEKTDNNSDNENYQKRLLLYTKIIAKTSNGSSYQEPYEGGGNKTIKFNEDCVNNRQLEPTIIYGTSSHGYANNEEYYTSILPAYDCVYPGNNLWFQVDIGIDVTTINKEAFPSTVQLIKIPTNNNIKQIHINAFEGFSLFYAGNRQDQSSRIINYKGIDYGLKNLQALFTVLKSDNIEIIEN